MTRSGRQIQPTAKAYRSLKAERDQAAKRKDKDFFWRGMIIGTEEAGDILKHMFRVI